MHEWPRIRTLDLPTYLEGWELHGIREWAYRFNTQSAREGLKLPVAWYLGHRMMNTIADLYQRFFRMTHAYANIYEHGTEVPMRFDFSGALCSASLFAALKGQAEVSFCGEVCRWLLI